MAATIEVDDKAVQQKLAALAVSMADTRPAMASIGRILTTRIQMGFRNGTSPWGAAWKPLKLRKGQPLRDTGRLMRSIGYSATPTEVTVGTSVAYARVHQFGATIKPKNKPRLAFKNPATGKTIFAKQVTVPARPFFPISPNGKASLPPAWSAAVIAALNKHILGGLPQ